MGVTVATKKVTIEVEVPEGFEWLGDVAREFIGKLTAYAILQAKAQARLSDEEIQEMVEEARQRVWERVKHAYTRD